MEASKNGPILNQPTGTGLVMEQLQREGGDVHIPPGLECLAALDNVFIKQEYHLAEVLLGCEMNNRYFIKSPSGQIMFNVKEDTGCCTRNCCGQIRPFDLYLKDLDDKPIIHLSRPLNCDSCCFPCCLQVMQVFSPPGILAGTIEQNWSIFPKFEIKDDLGNIVLLIEGPLCTCSCCCKDVEFHVLSADGVTHAGKISKKWSGLMREAFTDADNFGVSFPIDLSIQMKATLIGACFIIDFMYFEQSGKGG